MWLYSEAARRGGALGSRSVSSEGNAASWLGDPVWRKVGGHSTSATVRRGHSHGRRRRAVVVGGATKFAMDRGWRARARKARGVRRGAAVCEPHNLG